MQRFSHRMSGTGEFWALAQDVPSMLDVCAPNNRIEGTGGVCVVERERERERDPGRARAMRFLLTFHIVIDMGPTDSYRLETCDDN